MIEVIYAVLQCDLRWYSDALMYVVMQDVDSLISVYVSRKFRLCLSCPYPFVFLFPLPFGSVYPLANLQISGV